VQGVRHDALLMIGAHARRSIHARLPEELRSKRSVSIEATSRRLQGQRPLHPVRRHLGSRVMLRAARMARATAGSALHEDRERIWICGSAPSRSAATRPWPPGPSGTRPHRLGPRTRAGPGTPTARVVLGSVDEPAPGDCCLGRADARRPRPAHRAGVDGSRCRSADLGHRWRCGLDSDLLSAWRRGRGPLDGRTGLGLAADRRRHRRPAGLRPRSAARSWPRSSPARGTRDEG
jgi:hypothetical protein